MRGIRAVRCEGDLLRDGDSVTGERDNFFRLIRKDTDIREAEVAQDLRVDALIGAQEALAGHVALMLADGDALPKASALEEVSAAKEPSTVAVTLIPLVLPGRARRVNVTLDEALLEEIDRISDNRSGFLAEAARAELARRRA